MLEQLIHIAAVVVVVVFAFVASNIQKIICSRSQKCNSIQLEYVQLDSALLVYVCRVSVAIVTRYHCVVDTK